MSITAAGKVESEAEYRGSGPTRQDRSAGTSGQLHHFVIDRIAMT
jgi:hypothetical protein